MAYPALAGTSTGHTGCDASGNGKTTSHTITYPANVAAGDLLILWVTFATLGGADSTWTLSGWTQIRLKKSSDNDSGLVVFARVADSALSGNFTLTSSVNECIGWICDRITGGPAIASAVEASSGAAASSTYPDPDSLSPSGGSAEYLWMALAVLQPQQYGFANAPSGYSGYLEVNANSASAGTHMAQGWKQATASSEDPGQFGRDLAVAVDWAAVTLAIPTTSDIEFAPDAFGGEAGYQAGIAFAAAADVPVYPARYGAEAGYQDGLLFAATGARQVMLTGAGIETPEMTEGGVESNVLTFHENAKPTWEERGLTAAEVAALLSPDWYTCDSMTVTKGTLDAGAHTDLHATGGTTVAISEVTGTPGISVTLAFSGVDALTTWEVKGRYSAGVSAHEVHIQLWDYDASAWVTVGTMLAETVDHLYSGTLTDGAAYFDAGTGAAQMRLYHDENGNTSHDLFLDYVVIGHTTAGTVSLALDDLTDVNAPAPSDGDVLAWDDYAGEWVPVAASAPVLDWAEAGDLSTQAFGDLAAAGDSDEVPRANHKHAMMANPVPAHVAADDPHAQYLLEADLATALDYGEDGDISTLDYDDAADAGVLNEVARADHVHGMPSEGGGTVTTYSIDRQGDTADDYTKIASWTFDAQYDEVAFTLLFQGFRSTNPLYGFLLQCRSYISASETLTTRLVAIPLQSGLALRTSAFTVVYTSVSGYDVTAELYYRYTQNNEDMTFVPLLIAQATAGATPTFYSTQAYDASLPAGTAVSCEVQHQPSVVTAYGNAGSPHTWTKPAGLKELIVEVVGSGGGGGGCANTGVGQQSAASGGGAGGYARKVFKAADLPATCTVTVAQGGAGGSAGANNGTAGGTSSFAGAGITTVQATGGAVGIGCAAGTSANWLAGGLGGVGSGGDVNVAGGDGGNATRGSSYIPLGHGGGGGGLVGGISRQAPGSGTGTAGNAYGGGGAGGSIVASTAAVAGGAGADGVVVVTEVY